MLRNRSKVRVLVLCTGNSCRSQMAEGYLKHLGGERLEVFSAGLEAHGLNPLAVQVMAEDGVDISSHTSDTLQKYEGQEFDYIITVCDHAREQCPWFPTRAKKIHRNFPDPAKVKGSEEEVMKQFKQVRDSIKSFCKEFIREINKKNKL